MSEILKAPEPEFSYLPFTPEEIQEALDLLLENKVMERIGIYDGEMRYRLRDLIHCNRVHLAVTDCWDLQREIFATLYEVWKVRNPKNEEKRWTEFFYGSMPNSPLEQVLQELRHDRCQIKRSKQVLTTGDIKECSSSIKDKFDELIGRLNKKEPYGIFLGKILEYIYPHFMRNGINL